MHQSNDVQYVLRYIERVYIFTEVNIYHVLRQVKSGDNSGILHLCLYRLPIKLKTYFIWKQQHETNKKRSWLFSWNRKYN